MNPSTRFALIEDKKAKWIAGAVYTKQKLSIENIKALYEVSYQQSQHP
jgi:hypothetical protein